MLQKNIGYGLLTFIPIDRRWYLNMTANTTTFFSSVNSDRKVDIWTDVYLFDDQVVGVKTTMERIPVIDLHVNLSCPWSASTKMFRSNSSNRVSGNLLSISAWKYGYWFAKIYLRFHFIILHIYGQGLRIDVIPSIWVFLQILEHLLF